MQSRHIIVACTRHPGETGDARTATQRHPRERVCNQLWPPGTRAPQIRGTAAHRRPNGFVHRLRERCRSVDAMVHDAQPVLPSELVETEQCGPPGQPGNSERSFTPLLIQMPVPDRRHIVVNSMNGNTIAPAAVAEARAGRTACFNECSNCKVGWLLCSRCSRDSQRNRRYGCTKLQKSAATGSQAAFSR